MRPKHIDERVVVQEKIKVMKDKQLHETNQQRAVLGHWLSMDKQSQREAVKAHVDKIKEAQQQKINEEFAKKSN